MKTSITLSLTELAEIAIKALIESTGQVVEVVYVTASGASEKPVFSFHSSRGPNNTVNYSASRAE